MTTEEMQAAGYCCPEDGLGGRPCVHLREAAARWRQDDRVDQARAIRAAGGLPGLARLAGDGDPWAQEVFDSMFGHGLDGVSESPGLEGYAPDPFGPDPFAEHPDQPGLDHRRAPVGQDEPARRLERATDPARGAGATVEGREDADDAAQSWRAREQVLAEAGDQLGVPVTTAATMPGGPELAAALADLDPDELDRTAVIELVAAARRVQSWASAIAARGAAALSRSARLFDHPARDNTRERGGTHSRRRGVDTTSEEIALRLGISRHEATTLVRVGRGMRRTFTDTAAALEHGQIDYRKATTIITTLDESPTPVAWAVEQDILPTAAGNPAGKLRADIHDRITEVDPVEAEHRHARARARRHVTRTRSRGDGMATLTAVLPAPDSVQIDQTLTAIATSARAGGDPRTTDQLRADALLALAHAAILTGTTGPHTSPEGIPGLTAALGENPADATNQAADRAHVRAADNDDGGGTGHGSDHDAGHGGGQRSAGHARSNHDGDTGNNTAGATGTASAAGTADAAGQAPVQGHFPDLDPGIPEIAVISPLLAALLRRGGEHLPVVKPQIRVTIPADLLLEAQRLTTPSERQAPPEPDHGTTGSRRTPDHPAALGHKGAHPTAGQESAHPVAGQESAQQLAGQHEQAGATSAADPLTGIDAVPTPAATLAGYGAITDRAALALAAGGTLRAMITDPDTGVPLNLGRRRYRPPAGLQELIQDRDITCTRPGCAVPAHECQIDHTHPWAHGGQTNAADLELLCDRDHLIKTAGAMTVHRRSDGTVEWTTQTGHTYQRVADGTITLTEIKAPPNTPGADGPPPF